MTTQSLNKNHTLFLLTVGLLAWLIPGAGHFLLKKKKHALVIFATIVLTFCAGLYVGSLGVINWERAKPWYVAQIMNSPMVIILGDHVSGWLLFSIGSEFQSDLSNGIVSERLQQAFKNNKVPLSQDATVSIEQKGYIYRWLITGNKCSYSVRRVNGKLNVYTAYPVYGRPNEIGQIYTSITGLLNLLCIVNAVYLAHLRKTDRQKTDDRKQMTEDRRQKTDDRKQMTENRKQNFRHLTSEFCLAAGDSKCR